MAGSLEQSLRNLGWKEEWFAADETSIQDLAHAHLRALAVHHLRFNNTPLTQAYRGGFENETAWEDELDKLAMPGIWADEAQFMALAEVIGFHSKAYKGHTPLHDHLNHTCRLADGQMDTTKPTIDLVNSSGHWHRQNHTPNSTQGAGNCLFNACSQELQRLVQEERLQLTAQNTPALDTRVSPEVCTTTHRIPASTIKGTPRQATVSPQTAADDFEHIPLPARNIAAQVVHKAQSLYFEYNRLSRQLDLSTPEKLADAYKNLEKVVPCSSGAVANSRGAPIKTEDLDHLLALRLQLEEIEIYKRSCPPLL